MTEQTNAELIAEARTYVTDEYITPDTRPEESLIRRLAAALEAADQRAAEYAVVVEKVRALSDWEGPNESPAKEDFVVLLDSILATAPAAALREHACTEDDGQGEHCKACGIEREEQKHG